MWNKILLAVSIISEPVVVDSSSLGHLLEQNLYIINNTAGTKKKKKENRYRYEFV